MTHSRSATQSSPSSLQGSPADTPPASLLITGLSQVATPAAGAAPLRGDALRDVQVIKDAYILCEDGRISQVGPMSDMPDPSSDSVLVDAQGACAIPGLVDCHTHPAFAGDRVDEFSLKSAGESYESLHAAGKGIQTTVKATRAATLDELKTLVDRHKGWMQRWGTTTFEGKSGYGLDLGTELNSLQAVADAGGIPTWLGAHLLSPDFLDADEYLDFAVTTVMPRVLGLAEAADIFVGTGGFEVEQSRSFLQACMDKGLAGRIHGDQFGDDGAATLAIEVGARSIDHLESLGESSIGQLADSDVVAVLLPTSALYTGLPMPPARKLIDAGGAVALASDFNPGSSFCENLPLVCSLATLLMKLTPSEALSACTVNSAYVLNRSDRKGRIAPGYDADIVLIDAPDWRHLVYHLGGDLVATVIQAGKITHARN